MIQVPSCLWQSAGRGVVLWSNPFECLNKQWRELYEWPEWKTEPSLFNLSNLPNGTMKYTQCILDPASVLPLRQHALP